MAEPFGIAAGAVGIAAVFTTCVDCFNYVQVGRSFGRDYQTNVLTLTLAQGRLARWGNAVNIYTDPQLGNPKATRADVQTAKNALMHILGLFAESEKVARRFKLTGKAGDLSEYDVVDTDMMVMALNNKLRDLAVKRQKGASLLKVTSWALHHGEAFTKLVDQITKLIDGIQSIFPVPNEQQLAQQDIASVKDEESLLILKKIADGVDKVMKGAAETKLKGHIYRNVNAKDEAKVFNGNTILADWVGPLPQGGSHLYDGVHASGNAKVQNGDQYGGKGFFDD